MLGDALQRIHRGECVLDPAIVNKLLNRAREPGPLDELSPREREILSLMAEGHSNKRICELCFLSPKTVETHIHSILHEARPARLARLEPAGARGADLPPSLTEGRRFGVTPGVRPGIPS